MYLFTVFPVLLIHHMGTNSQTSQYNVLSNHTHYSGHHSVFRVTLDKLLKRSDITCVRIKTQRHTEMVLRKS